MSYRVPDRGLIDRTTELTFRFDGRELTGHPGDTLASALLANGIGLIGRSFKYHRPRGVLSAGPEEPNALVELRAGARLEPNTRATTVELFAGLEARSQNRWPSLRLDLMAANQWLAPLLVAGFYYKTFKWPPSFWEPVYERLIRRAAGLGRATRAPDPDAYEHVHAHPDVLVVGAGPAGLMAARAAAETGARVLLAEQQPWLGGRLVADREMLSGQPATTWLAEIEAELHRFEELQILTRTTVFGIYDHDVVGAVERVADHLPDVPAHHPRQRLWLIRPRQIVFATGAQERPLVFEGNDRPGVMLAAAARTYLERFGVAVGRRVVIATTGDDAYRTALALAEAGVAVAAVLDARDQPGPIAAEAARQGIEVRPATLPLTARGRVGVTGLVVQDRNGNPAGELACDAILTSGGFDPSVHLASQTGAKPVFDETIAAFVPGKPVRNERSAGAARGRFALADCLADGVQAGAEAALLAGFSSPAQVQVPAVARAEEHPIAAVWACPGAKKAFVDFQNDVTAFDLRLAAREGYRSVEHAKRYTTLGMATDQGKTANVNGLAILAEARGEPIAAVGTTTFRPPFTPVALGVFAGPERGPDFAPTRRTAIHAWHERHGAVFTEAGLWLRPQAYLQDGEDLLAATKREAAAVRTTAGLCDVSTLGKIDLFGPDAVTFLNRLYVNGFSKLAVGRARYGLMLREDGHVFDDGTVTKLGDHRFFITTTTANAAAVLAHMEHYAQVVWPELDVAFCSATDQWAGIALAGPRARDVLGAVVADDVSNPALPFMGVLETALEGVPLRIFRISFSGELAYELTVPSGYGEALWERLMAAGEPFAITPYGVEALSVLRIEKGHIAGPEIDGRTTPADLGLGRMVSGAKPCVGKAMLARPGLSDPRRPALVGIRPTDSGGRLRGGAHLVETGSTRSLGWVTSVAPSPAVGCWIGLALVTGGPERKGQRLVATFPLRDEAVEVEITDPCFVDPAGERLRG